MERYFGVKGRANVQRILDAVEESGGTVLSSPSPSVAPYEFRVRTRTGEILDLICYAFTANKYMQRGRPVGEHRFQVKYGSDFKRPHQIFQDPTLSRTTLMFGIHEDIDVFVAVDPAAHNPTWFSSSIEFKETDLKKVRSRWHGWERERVDAGRRRAGPASSDADFSHATEVVIGFGARHFLDFAMFERIASGMDAGERLLLSDNLAKVLNDPKAVARMLSWPPKSSAAVGAQHPLLIQFGLTAEELFATLASRFRLMAAVRGGVAEVHLGRLLRETPGIRRVEHVDADGQPDFTVLYKKKPFRIECKNVLRRLQRNVPRVDFQKTRASKSDPCSRYYDALQFEILAACLHPITERWEFQFCSTATLPVHATCPDKLASNVRVAGEAWQKSLPELLDAL